MNLSVIMLSLAFAFQNADVPAKYAKPAPSKNTVIGKVNGVEIKAGEIQDLLWEWRSSEVMADIVTLRMIQGAAKKANISVTDAEIEDGLTKQLAQLTPTVTNGQSPEDYLLERGFTKSRLWIRIKTDLLLNKLAAVDFKAGDYVKVSTLIVKPDSISSNSLAEAVKKADLYYDKLTKGEDWETVLALSTLDDAILRTKGVIGWRRAEAFPEIVRNEFEKLKAGGYTRPVQTTNGIQIFRIDMFGKDAKGKDLEDAIAIHVTSNKSPVLKKIQSESRVERIPQNS